MSVIIKTTTKIKEEELRKKEKELSKKIGQKVVLLGPEYGPVIEV